MPRRFTHNREIGHDRFYRFTVCLELIKGHADGELLDLCNGSKMSRMRSRGDLVDINTFC